MQFLYKSNSISLIKEKKFKKHKSWDPQTLLPVHGEGNFISLFFSFLMEPTKPNEFQQIS